MIVLLGPPGWRSGLLGLGSAVVIGMLLLASTSSHTVKVELEMKVVQRGNNVQKKSLSPVILVPGVSGSQLDAKLDKPSVVHSGCLQKAEHYSVWLNFDLRIKEQVACWIDNVSLRYDNVTRCTSNAPGVTTRVPGWGNPEMVEWLEPTHASVGGYYKDIGNALVAAGYVRNVSLRGAPYDFRKGPNENTEWFANMKTLVEETYSANGNRTVTLIVHSMGGPMTLRFMHLQSGKWKDKHIARIIALAGAWGGSVKALKVFAIGDNFGLDVLNATAMRQEQRTSPSLAWLLPSPLFWHADEVLVQTLGKTYRMANLEEFFADLHIPNGWEMRKNLLEYIDLTAPGVEVHCLFGTDVPTIERLDYRTASKAVDGETPTLVMGDGDGTVNARSLRGCSRWTGSGEMRGKTVKVVEMPKVNHMQVLRDSRVLQYVLDTLLH